MSVVGRPRRQMSLTRFLITSNVYTVVACFGVLPFFTLWDLGVMGGLSFAFLTALVVPLLWALTSFVMIRDRVVRSAAVAALLISPLVATLVFAARTSVFLYGSVAQRGLTAVRRADGTTRAIALIGVALLTLAIVALVCQTLGIGGSGRRERRTTGGRGGSAERHPVGRDEPRAGEEPGAQ